MENINEEIKKEIVMKSFEFQGFVAIILSAVFVCIPFLIISIAFPILFIFLAILIIAAVVATIMFYLKTKKEVVFSKEGIKILKDKKEISNYKWDEIKVEYLGIENVLSFKAFTMEITVYDKTIHDYKSSLIACRKKKYDELMSLQKN